MSEPSLPFGGSSVMAGRAPIQHGELDYFPTPPWAARAGGELIRALDPMAKTCWEPACGGGHMAHALRDFFAIVRSSDIFDYSDVNPDQDRVVDFLAPETAYLCGAQQPDWIVSNPPFKDGEAFFRLAYERAARGVAMLLRLSFIESGARHRLFSEVPLTVLAPFSERVPMVKGRYDPDASSATAYAWFICAKPCAVSDRFPEPVVRLIGPGAKSRLVRQSDLLRFGQSDQADLLDAGAAA